MIARKCRDNPKIQQKERWKFDTPTHIHYRLLFWLGISSSMKADGVMSFAWHLNIWVGGGWLCVYRHFQQNISYIISVSFIGGGETNIPWENHRHTTSHSLILLYNVENVHLVSIMYLVIQNVLFSTKISPHSVKSI